MHHVDSRVVGPRAGEQGILAAYFGWHVERRSERSASCECCHLSSVSVILFLAVSCESEVMITYSQIHQWFTVHWNNPLIGSRLVQSGMGGYLVKNVG